MSQPPANRPRATHRGDDAHVPFLALALALGVLGGFTLAVSLPVEAALGGLDAGWVSHAQVHGHLQVVGFAALFVFGVAMKLAPRFASRSEIALFGLITPGLVMLAAGVLMRALGQPLADHAPMAAMLAAGAWLEMLGAVALAAVIVATMRPAILAGEPPALLLGIGVSAFVVQAALGAWWLTDLASDGGTILAHSRNATLVNLQFFGVLLGAILGVGTRTFPTFFGLPPTSGPIGRVTAALLVAGLALWSIGTTNTDVPDWVGNAGRAGVGIAILSAVATFGLQSRRNRLAAASSGYVWALRPVLLWLAVTGVLLGWSGLRPLAGGSASGVSEVDSIRHIFAIGVVTLAIVGMAQLILPEFASERLVRKPSQWRGAAFGATLSLAAVLRGVLPWAGLFEDQRWWLMATGGSLGLVATAAFAFLCWRARRSHTAYRRRIAAARSTQAIPMADG